MTSEVQQYALLESEDALIEFYESNKSVSWLCFDTEFVGERRYATLLCLIQVATEHGFYFIDALKIKNLTPFFKLIEDPAILKITHAGDNDYRLLYAVGGVVPKNVFDIQLAAGFIGYKYPVSFRKIASNEINVKLGKGYTVTDWEARPFTKNQLKYALDDVLYLYPIYEKIIEKLEAANRVDWVKEECVKWEDPENYVQHPYREALRSNLIKNLKPQQQAFLMRLYAWRDDQAKRKNYSKEMILPNKLINTIVKSISSGKAALKGSRIIPDKIVKRHWETFNTLFQTPINEEERAFLMELPGDAEENPQQEIYMDMLYLLVKHTCLHNKIAPTLVIQRNMLKKMAVDSDYVEPTLENGWRRKLLGEELVKWLRVRNEMEFEMKDGKCMLWMKNLP